MMLPKKDASIEDRIDFATGQLMMLRESLAAMASATRSKHGEALRGLSDVADMVYGALEPVAHAPNTVLLWAPDAVKSRRGTR